MSTIKTQIETARGCGYRKTGGMYFVSDGIGNPCCKLPFPLTVCPCCGAGYKQTRGFTWVTSDLFAGSPCTNEKISSFPLCPMNLPGLKVGLMWVGEKYYPTAEHFTREANALGVSKRFAALPKEFEVGKTWIYLGHAKAVHSINAKGNIEFMPGIFRAFRPARIEYIVGGWETNETLSSLEKRGFTLVKVIRDTDTQRSIL